MMLCHLCRHIPFEEPEPLPSFYITGLPGLPGGDDLYYVEHRDRDHPYPRAFLPLLGQSQHDSKESSPYPSPFGYPHYQSQHDLKKSARDCDLCDLMYRQFLRIVKHHASAPRADFRFFITQREGDQEGFVVWTPAEHDTIWRVGAFGYVVKDENDPLYDIFRGRYIHKDPSGASAKKLAKYWIRNCVNHHGTLCGPPQGLNTPLPTRVIDVGKPGSKSIKLLETDGSTKPAPYTILSYSWGPPPHVYQMTGSNRSEYKKGISFGSKPPQTILDAIEITRMAGIQYLWVDALCIIQDDPSDWASESAKMMDYYGNSYLTISATSSQSAYDGIFKSREAPTATDIPYTSDSGDKGTLTIFALDPYMENIQANYLIFEGEPIMGRGWTLQERVLSTRILHYTSDQMYYECNTHFRSEDGFHVQGRQFSTNPNTKELSIFGGSKPSTDSMWDTLVQDYGGRAFTHADKDKFVAFSGLARKFSTMNHGDEYIAGLWKKRIIESLFWSTDDDPKRVRPHWHSTWPPATYRAPSWSWACLDAPIFNPDGRIYKAKKYAILAKYSVVPKSKANPYGQIDQGAYLLLTTPELTHLQAIVHHSTPLDVDWCLFHDKHTKMVSVPGTTRLDYQFSSSQFHDLNVHALALARGVPFGTVERSVIKGAYYLCLLVTQIPGHNYRRIGTVWLYEEALGNNAPGDADPADWTNIYLV